MCERKPTLSNAEIEEISVKVGSIVTVREYGYPEDTFQIISGFEKGDDYKRSNDYYISVDSPLGKAVLYRRCGDKVIVVPKGMPSYELEIIRINNEGVECSV